jgi:hypothetical protein
MPAAFAWRTPEAPVGVVEGPEPIDADADVAHADGRQPLRDAGIDQHAIAGELRRDADFDRAAQEIEEVRAQQGLATAEDHDPNPTGGHLLDEPEGLFEGEIARRGLRHGSRVTVGTRHVAVHTDVPDHDGRVFARASESPGSAQTNLGTRDTLPSHLE